MVGYHNPSSNGILVYSVSLTGSRTPTESRQRRTDSERRRIRPITSPGRRGASGEYQADHRRRGRLSPVGFVAASNQDEIRRTLSVSALSRSPAPGQDSFGCRVAGVQNDSGTLCYTVASGLETLRLGPAQPRDELCS